MIKRPDHLVVGMTGASGLRYGTRLVEILVQMGWNVHLMMTKNSWRVLQEEEKIPGVGSSSPLTQWLKITEDQAMNQVTLYHINDIAAKPASGTFHTRGMVILPASMKTCGCLAHGVSGDLLGRCADVFMKEKRPLVIAPRETPLSSIHLQNLLTLSQAGAHIVPVMPGFYCDPKTIDDLVDFMVAKILNLLEIDHQLSIEWKGPG